MSQFLPKYRAREYETIFILHPESKNDVVDSVANRCQDVLAKLDGKLLRAENWGRRRLAYPVRKNAKGIYIYLNYLGYQTLVAELERNLRVLDPVIKFMTVKVDEDVNPEARPVADGDISFIARFDDSEVKKISSEKEEVPVAASSDAADTQVTEEASAEDEAADTAAEKTEPASEESVE